MRFMTKKQNEYFTETPACEAMCLSRLPFTNSITTNSFFPLFTISATESIICALSLSSATYKSFRIHAHFSSPRVPWNIILVSEYSVTYFRSDRCSHRVHKLQYKGKLASFCYWKFLNFPSFRRQHQAGLRECLKIKRCTQVCRPTVMLASISWSWKFLQRTFLVISILFWSLALHWKRNEKYFWKID